jgi:hypothetical protein
MTPSSGRLVKLTINLENTCTLVFIYLSTRFPRSAMKLFTMTVFPRPVSCIMTMHFCLSCLQRYGFLCYFLSAVTMPLAAGEISLGLLVMQITGQGYRQNWIGRQTWSSVDFKCSLRLFQYYAHSELFCFHYFKSDTK